MFFSSRHLTPIQPGPDDNSMMQDSAVHHIPRAVLMVLAVLHMINSSARNLRHAVAALLNTCHYR